MHVPTELTDWTLLDEEPLREAFAERDKALRRGTRKTRKSGPAARERIARKKFDTCGAFPAVEAWLALAFTRTEDDVNASVDTSQVTDDLLDIFVEYHWLLSKFSVRDANQFLYEERKKREFVSTIESVAPSGPSRRNSGNSAGQAGSDRNKSDAADPEDASFSLSFTSTSTAVTTSKASTSHQPGEAPVGTMASKTTPAKRKKNQSPVHKRVQPRRSASNREEMSRLATAETSGKMKKLKSGNDDVDSMAQVTSTGSGTKPKRRGRPPKVQATSRVAAASTSEDASIADVPSASTRSVTYPVAAQKPKTARKPSSLTTKTAKKPKIARTKSSRGDLQPQIAKKKRGNDKSAIPVETKQAESATSPALDVVQGSTEPGSPSVSRGKRAHSVVPVSSKMDKPPPRIMSLPPTSRTIAPLPSISSRQMRRSVAPRAPSVPPLDTNLPKTFDEVDSVIRDAAAEGVLLLQAANGPPAPAWTRDDDAAEESSDDEEDIPLQDHLLKSRAEVEASPSVVEGVTIPSETIMLPKRPLPGYPPVWAETRQEVCESFDWFRSYQGGVYFTNDMVKGYLLSAFSASRDIFHHNGKLIVSHGGGRGAESLNHKPSSGPHYATDQLANDKSVRALMNTMQVGRPLVLIIDDKYSLFPYDLASKSCTYAVLGFYRIAHAWAEKQAAPGSDTGVVRYKFAFQWCQEQGDPWWWREAPDMRENIPILENIPLYPPRAEPTPATPSLNYLTCTTCNNRCPQVYAEGWMCLHTACPSFFTVNGSAAPASLTYSEPFVQLKTFRHDSISVGDIRPPLPNANPDDGIATSKHACKGWHCRKCGRLSCRFMWEHWECRNCQNVLKVNGNFRLAAEFRHQVQGEHFHLYRHAPHSGIIQSKLKMYNFGRGYGSFVTFQLPSGRGNIHVIFSSPLAHKVADEILAKYQEEAASGRLRFRRWPLRSHKCRGALLTNYFSQNTGEPYNYVAGTDNTVTWEEAPSAVEAARSLINERMKQALNLDYHFNEVLSAGYMEKQKMAFHSDAERGLGPTVASLSLGAAAYMHFRLLAPYAKELPEGCSREVLSLFLKHGDVVVMEGADVQKYYEHTVVPLNFRIAATARFIDSSNH